MKLLLIFLLLPLFVNAQKAVYKDTLSIGIILQKKDGTKLPTQNIWKISFRDSNTVVVRNRDSTRDFYFIEDAVLQKDSLFYRFIPLLLPQQLQEYLTDSTLKKQVDFSIQYVK